MEPSPRIRTIAWGRIATDAGSFRDAKLWPGGGRGWDWGETGTRHEPGIQAADVAEVLEHGARLLVLGRGQHERLGVTDEALALIRAHGAEAEVLSSRDAVARYNGLADAGEAVGALIHTTC